jgi:hypothetical protein
MPFCVENNALEKNYRKKYLFYFKKFKNNEKIMKNPCLLKYQEGDNVEENKT